MICNECKKDFEDHTGKRKYCSKKCAGQSKRVKRTCLNCGNRLTYKNKKFCCVECASKYRKAHRDDYQYNTHCPSYKKFTPEEAKQRLLARSVKWQKENKVKVYTALMSRKNKDLLTILYECPCDHPKKQNHHPRYEAPLEILKLCPSCHAKEHKRLRSLSVPTEEIAVPPPLMLIAEDRGTVVSSM